MGLGYGFESVYGIRGGSSIEAAVVYPSGEGRSPSVI